MNPGESHIMTTKEEQARKKLEEERRQQEALGRELEQRRKDEITRNPAMSPPLPTEDEQPKNSPVIVQGTTNDKDWQKIKADYQKKYPDNIISNDTLEFPSQTDAIEFFSAQAASNPPQRFLCKELGADGQPTGFNLFSCGDGKLYQGNLNEIHAQLKAALVEKPDSSAIKEGIETIQRLLNPAQNFRAAIQDTRPSEDTPEPFNPKPKMTPL